jgi:signal recognition particle receptor subunit beta
MPWSRKPAPLKIVVIGEAQVGKTCFIDMVSYVIHFIVKSHIDIPMNLYQHYQI